MRIATVDRIVTLNAERIRLVSYEPCWRVMFLEEMRVLREKLGGWPKSIDHVGSTSVPGLIAKPIIDILIGVDDLKEVENYDLQLSGLGYNYYPEFERQLPARKLFIKRQNQRERSHHLQFVCHQTDFWWQHLRFAQILQTDPAVTRRYAALKQANAKLYATDRAAYTAAKTEFIRKCLS